jgi:hypothetical protein
MFYFILSCSTTTIASHAIKIKSAIIWKKKLNELNNFCSLFSHSHTHTALWQFPFLYFLVNTHTHKIIMKKLVACSTINEHPLIIIQNKINTTLFQFTHTHEHNINTHTKMCGPHKRNIQKENSLFSFVLPIAIQQVIIK